MTAAAGGPRLRLLLVSDAYPPLIGGANRSTQQLAQAMAERGHRVVVATAHQPGVPEHEHDGPVEVHRIRDLTTLVPWVSADPYVHIPPPFPDPQAVLRLRSLIRELSPDVVHAYGWLAHSCAAALVGSSIPLVLAARDYGNFCAVRTFLHGEDRCGGPGVRTCLRCASRFYGTAKGAVAVGGVAVGRSLLRRRTRSVHAVSRFVGETIDSHVLGGSAVQVTVIPNFRDESADAADPGAIEGLPHEPFVLYVGAFRRVKGVHVLLEAYDLMRRPRPPLVLIGTLAPDTPVFPPGVHVLHDVPHAGVMAAWDRALLGVFPSVIAEPLGNVVHEAMSRGRAVIGTRPGGHEDLIEHERTGLLVPAGSVSDMAEAMQRLVDDDELRDRLGAAAVAGAVELRADNIVPRLEALLVGVARRGMG